MTQLATTVPDQVVLLDEGGHAIGAMPKQDVHHHSTPLHLAFSAYLFDATGHRVLVTQRAHHKTTWPAEWTNSCCGHPGPGEPVQDAVRRRVEQELGARVDLLRLVLPTFRYRAVMPNGMVENEICPVFFATTTDTVRPNPEEVAAAVWEPWVEFRAGVLQDSRPISPWCRAQVALLPVDPLAAVTRPSTELPPAARPEPTPPSRP